MRPSAVLAPLVLAPLVLVALGACDPAAVTPGTRTLPMASPLGPPPGRSDLQADIGGGAEFLFGPSVDTGDARVRHAIRPTTLLEGDVGTIHVAGAGGGADRMAYTGRLGVVLQSTDHHYALDVGLGGGLSRAAGSWGAFDVGGVASGSNHWVRPVLGAAFGYSAPVGNRTFDVYTGGDALGDGSSATLQLPRNLTLRFDFGLELGPPDRALVLGLSAVMFELLTSDVAGSSQIEPSHASQTYLVAGFGTRITL